MNGENHSALVLSIRNDPAPTAVGVPLRRSRKRRNLEQVREPQMDADARGLNDTTESALVRVHLRLHATFRLRVYP